MSKTLDLYNKLKEENKEAIYCVKNGNFFNFYNEDAKLINELINLKITQFGHDLIKCGFPLSQKEKYTELLKEKEIDLIFIEIESDVNSKPRAKKNKNSEIEKIVKEILELDLENLTDRKAFVLLCEYQNRLKK